MRQTHRSNENAIAAELIVGLDQLPLASGTGRLIAARRGGRPAGPKLLMAGGLLAATVLVAMTAVWAGMDKEPQGAGGPPPGASAGVPAPSASATASPSASVTPKADRTPEPPPTGTIAPQHLRLLWTYLPDREAIAFQNEARHADGIRVVASDGEVIASERVRPAESGEPRTCGGGIRWPIAVLTLPADVIADFRQGSAQGSQTRLATYRVEVAQSDGIWHPVSVDQLLDRAQLAGAPCYEW